LITIVQKCDSCGTERVLTVPGFGTDLSDVEQMRRVNAALSSEDWQPLGAEWWIDPPCIETKLGINLEDTPPSGGDVPISYD